MNCLIRLRQPVGTVAPFSTSRFVSTFPHPSRAHCGAWPPPPRASLGHGREGQCTQCRKSSRHARTLVTDYVGRFPFIAFMGRHVERSYVAPSPTLSPCRDHTSARTDPSSTFTDPLTFSDLAAEPFADLSMTGSSSIHLPATQPEQMNSSDRETHVSARPRLVATN